MTNDVSVFINIVYAENATYPQLLNAGACSAGDIVLIKSKDNPGGSLWTHSSEFKFVDPTLVDQILQKINEELIKPDNDGNIKLTGNLILNNSTEDKDNDAYIETYKVIANSFDIISNDGESTTNIYTVEQSDNNDDIVLKFNPKVIIQAEDIILDYDGQQIDVKNTIQNIINCLEYIDIDKNAK